MIKRLAILATIVPAVFWPVWYYRSELRFDSAVFTTEWLKITFSSVILFLIVEMFLDRNRAAAVRSTFQRAFVMEVAQPLAAAATLVNQAQQAAVPGSEYSPADLCSGLERAYDRLNGALLHLPLLSAEPALLVHISSLATVFRSYNWLTAAREFAQVTTWRPANIGELNRLRQYITDLQTQVDAVQAIIGAPQ